MSKPERRDDGRPAVIVLLTPAMRRQMLDPAAERRLAEVAEVRAPTAATLADQPLAALIGDARACLTGWGSPPLADGLLAALPRLRMIAHSAGSVRRLVSPQALERGLRLSHAARHIAEAVAEFVIAQMLDWLRRPALLDAGMRAREPWLELRGRLMGGLLGERTVGLIGAGYVGRLVIALLRPFGCRILVADPFLDVHGADRLGVTLASLDELLADADIVSLHAPVLPATYGMIGAGELARLKDGALFINTARAALVDEAALLRELRTGRIDAMLDVFATEPLPADSPFRDLSNIILAPHAAGHTHDTHRRQGRTAVEEIRRFLEGEPLECEVTASMFRTMA